MDWDSQLYFICQFDNVIVLNDFALFCFVFKSHSLPLFFTPATSSLPQQQSLQFCINEPDVFDLIYFSNNWTSGYGLSRLLRRNYMIYPIPSCMSKVLGRNTPFFFQMTGLMTS